MGVYLHASGEAKEHVQHSVLKELESVPDDVEARSLVGHQRRALQSRPHLSAACTAWASNRVTNTSEARPEEVVMPSLATVTEEVGRMASRLFCSEAVVSRAAVVEEAGGTSRLSS